MPMPVYVLLWGASLSAIVSDIYMKQHDSAKEDSLSTILYYTSFHIPASLIIPAVIIHKIGHLMESSMPNYFSKNLSSKVKIMLPICVTLLSIYPVVFMVDTTAEKILEPTLGKYLNLDFPKHG